MSLLSVAINISGLDSKVYNLITKSNLSKNLFANFLKTGAGKQALKAVAVASKLPLGNSAMRIMASKSFKVAFGFFARREISKVIDWAIKKALADGATEGQIKLAKANIYVEVGIPAGLGTTEGLDNATLGRIHETGSAIKNIPPRPFLMPAIEEFTNGGELGVIMAKYSKEDTKTMLSIIGMAASVKVKKRIVDQTGFTALSMRTMQARQKRGFKGEKALIESGSMLNSITYRVVCDLEE